MVCNGIPILSYVFLPRSLFSENTYIFLFFLVLISCMHTVRIGGHTTWSLCSAVSVYNWVDHISSRASLSFFSYSLSGMHHLIRLLCMIKHHVIMWYTILEIFSSLLISNYLSFLKKKRFPKEHVTVIASDVHQIGEKDFLCWYILRILNPTKGTGCV